MAFEDGFYKVTFGTPLGHGSGVAHIADGKLHGGDSMMAYVGSFKQDGDAVSAEVRVFTHTSVPNMASALGVKSATLSLSGTASSSGAQLSGTSPQAPGVSLKLTLQPLGA